jgi:hypothetical protein
MTLIAIGTKGTTKTIRKMDSESTSGKTEPATKVTFRMILSMEKGLSAMVTAELLDCSGLRGWSYQSKKKRASRIQQLNGH